MVNVVVKHLNTKQKGDEGVCVLGIPIEID
jgi:hypothetical protein